MGYPQLVHIERDRKNLGFARENAGWDQVVHIVHKIHWGEGDRPVDLHFLKSVLHWRGSMDELRLGEGVVDGGTGQR